MMQKIAIGADHAGYELKELLRKWLEKNSFITKDFGTYSAESTDYFGITSLWQCQRCSDDGQQASGNSCRHLLDRRTRGSCPSA
jgi:hypothetical protein